MNDFVNQHAGFGPLLLPDHPQSVVGRPVTGLPYNLTQLARDIHADNIAAGWWKVDPLTGDTLPRNIGELLCLVHSEISEADAGDAMDDKLPHRKMFEVELGDAAIRVLDILGYYQTDVFLWPLWVPLTRSEALLLMHRTASAAMEGFRKGKPERGVNELRKLLSVIHIAAVQSGCDLSGAIAEKREFNRNRADHKPENRAKAGGKQF